MKKLIIPVISVGLLMGCAYTSYAQEVVSNKSGQNVAAASTSNSFSDVSKTHWAYKEIEYLRVNDIAEAYSGTSYMPNENITRAKAARMLVKAKKVNVNDPAIPEIELSDVSKSDPDYPYIKAAVYKKIFDGYPDGTFKPKNALTRAQMAKVIVNTFELKGVYPYHFKDVTTSNWASGFVSQLAANEVTTGYIDNTYKPNNSTTRGQMAAFIYRAIMGSDLKIAPINRFSALDGKLKNGMFVFGKDEYLPKGNVTPDISRKIYSLANSLVDDQHYTEVSYMKDMDNLGSYASVSFSPTATAAAYGNCSFYYTLSENKYLSGKEYHSTFSNKGSIRLTIKALSFYDDYATAKKNYFTDPIYLTALNNSLVSLFGNDGKGIYDFIVDGYIDNTKAIFNGTDPSVKRTKKFNKVQVDLYDDFQGKICALFTFL